LGAHDVIDYRSQDFTRTTQPYDLILDMVAHRSMLAYRRALTPHGRYRCVGGSVRTLLRAVTIGPVVGALTGRSIGILAVKQGPSHFEPLAAMCSAGSVKVNVDSVYPLDEVPEALERVGEGRALGKVVITMGR
jgi:NADPH:quinone reductase-like Zn-dependent oxidoreductase